MKLLGGLTIYQDLVYQDLARKKKLENRPKIVLLILIFGGSIPCVFCLFQCSVSDRFPKKRVDMRVGGVSSIQFLGEFCNYFLCKAPEV